MSVVSSSESDAVIANPLRASGLIDARSVELARAYARDHGGSMGDALLRLNLVKEGDFLRVFAELYSTRFVKAEKLKTLTLDEVLLERVGVRTAERLRMCPIRWDPSNLELHVVAGIPLSSNLEPELRLLLGARSVVVYVATSGAVSALVRRAYEQRHDAFDAVTANGAGPPLGRHSAESDAPPAPRGEVEAVAESLAATPLLSPVPRAVSAPSPFPTLPPSPLPTLPPSLFPTLPPSPLPMGAPTPTPAETKTVLLSLEALTIAALRRENARYRIAQEFHRRVSLERDVATMVERILAVVFELLPADGAAVWLTSGRYSSRAREGSRTIDVPRAIIDETLGSQSGLLTHNALTDERFDRSHTVMARGVRSVMAVPLRTRRDTIGILYVESLSMSAAFTEDDLPLLDSLAAQAALLLENAALIAQVQQEMETRASLARFLSQAAVEEVLSGRLKLSLQGQTSELTVLFADLRGFTTLSSHMKPEEVVRFLNAFFSEATEAVEGHGGIVDKFVGDCVMALWGAIEPTEDDARRAIAAALEVVERAKRILVRDASLKVGVGLHTGRAVVGAIGGKKRLDYTAVGATVNLAARLCTIAEAQEVLVTAETLMRAGPGVVSEATSPVFLKGLEAPVMPYRIRSLAAPADGGPRGEVR